jgi:hypothetical protein
VGPSSELIIIGIARCIAMDIIEVAGVERVTFDLRREVGRSRVIPADDTAPTPAATRPLPRRQVVSPPRYIKS